MRRGKGKLSTFNWMLVLLAGIFQITTFILDQIVIQYEEDFRKINFKILSKSESRSAYLKMNNRVNDFLLAFENTIFLVSASNFSEDKKKFYYFSNIFDQTRLMEDILNDKMVIDGLSGRTIQAADTNNYELDQKEFSFEKYFRGLIEDNHWLTEQLEKNPDFVIKYEDLDGIEKTSSALETIKAYVQHNNNYLQNLLDAMAELGIKASSDLDNLINESSKIENRKQLLLLLGVSSQLISLLCLLILFRRLLMNKVYKSKKGLLKL
tara:strand:- start:73 stop:870 length:798 start_codon:yes stop_codon:yes gene_type:complete